MCVRSETKTASWIDVVAQDRAHAVERFQGVAALVFHEDPVGGHAVVDRVGAADGGLGGAVAGQLAAGHDEVA